MRRALVTGAGSADGIGFAAARRLARESSVVITSTTDRVLERAAEIGAEGIVADLTSWEECERVAALGPFDVLVNNAGMVQTGVDAPDRLFTELTEAEWLRGIDLTLHLTFRLCRLVAPQMTAGDPAQLVINERHQALEGFLVADVPFDQKFGYIGFFSHSSI